MDGVPAPPRDSDDPVKRERTGRNTDREKKGKVRKIMGNGRSRGVMLPAYYGLLIALAFVFSYIESLIPFSVGIPGVKLGLGNLVSIITLYTLGWQAAAAVSLVRVILTGFTFGSMSMMMYGLAGAALSLLVMILSRHLDLFGITGVSIAGGVAHNIGQIAVAAMVLESGAIFYYLPVLLLSGSIAGAVIGFLGGLIVKRLQGVLKIQ